MLTHALPLPDWQDPEADLPGRIILAGGCFWCVEGVYRELAGVQSAVSGYTGGRREEADYRSVCSGATNHAEAVELRYDPEKLQFGEILQVFFGVAHDPTQRNRQGNDIGRQYRSAIFFLNDAQADMIRAYIAQLEKGECFAQPIVTELEPLQEFYPAEAYHQDYARRNPGQPYICAVAQPKIHALAAMFPEYRRKA
ncbi:peptide-methionine (S)-S-oxide reductase MsrA [Acidithiobacillus sp. IBUN Pt1247-S3]|uniref:peptide-methionine (S)-S-oxide reductase MsrA n=1 Tax=Acidithiobacillus sp. IBUN Pt1247-S3 TaxID=3166642 RepID=UPI0034E5505D